MKKLSLVCMAALLIAAASCKKEEKNEKFDGGFRAKTETHAGDSKTQLVGQKDVIWSEGDQITVFSEQSPNGQVFTATDFGKNDVIFSADVDETYYSQSEFTSVYPDATKSGDNYQITLGATQAYTENGFASGANPMTAHSTNTTLNFKNVCGLLQLNLYSEATTTVKVKDITIYSNKTGEKLNGNGKLTINAEGIPTLTNLDGGNALTLTCNNVELSKNAESATPFFFVVPAGALSEGLEVVVTDENDAIWYRKTTSNCTITRSNITSLSPICVVPEICTEVQLWAGGPLWSTCNLGAEHPHYYGDYYAWGATSTLYSTQPAQTGTSTAVALPSGVSYGYNQYCPHRTQGNYGPNTKWDRYTYGDNKYAASGVVDDEKVLWAVDDAATANNSNWRMPTIEEFLEMVANTEQEWTEDYHHQNVKGYIIRGKGAYADKCIFLPAAGCIEGTTRSMWDSQNQQAVMYYWTATLAYAEPWAYGPAPYEAYTVERWRADGVNLRLNRSWSMRYVGFPIRAIKK